MASGKTTVGSLLARLVDRPFVELDSEIERAEGMSIGQIFELHGETFFRRVESAALGRLADRSPSVVATGGGTVVVDSNLEFLRATGMIVWLDPPFDVVAARIAQQEAEVRPLYRDRDQARQLFTERLPAYRRADLRVRIGAEEAPPEVAQRVASTLREASCGI